MRYIRAEYGDYFGLTVAGYPEAHPDVIKTDPEEQKKARAPELQRRVRATAADVARAFRPQAYAADLAYLKQKVDAGGYAPQAFAHVHLTLG